MFKKEKGKQTELSPAQERAVRLWDNDDVKSGQAQSGSEIPAHKRGASQIFDPKMGADVDDRRPVKYDTEELQKKNRIKE